MKSLHHAVYEHGSLTVKTVVKRRFIEIFSDCVLFSNLLFPHSQFKYTCSEYTGNHIDQEPITLHCNIKSLQMLNIINYYHI